MPKISFIIVGLNGNKRFLKKIAIAREPVRKPMRKPLA